MADLFWSLNRINQVLLSRGGTDKSPKWIDFGNECNKLYVNDGSKSYDGSDKHF